MERYNLFQDLILTQLYTEMYREDLVFTLRAILARRRHNHVDESYDHKKVDADKES